MWWLTWLAVAPELEVHAPWEVEASAEDHVQLRLPGTSWGVRLDLDGTVSPTWEAQPTQAPRIAVPFPGRVSRAVVSTEGLDVVVRLYGPTLDTVLVDPHAPADPVLTWVRLRPRGATWKLVIDGVADVCLDGSDFAARPVDAGLEIRSDRSGGLTWSTSARATSSRLDAHAWCLSLRPALVARDPYPRTTFEWHVPGAWRLGLEPGQPFTLPAVKPSTK